jgi:3D (Asp-Asp-Asp) domain-containing protein
MKIHKEVKMIYVSLICLIFIGVYSANYSLNSNSTLKHNIIIDEHIREKINYSNQILIKEFEIRQLKINNSNLTKEVNKLKEEHKQFETSRGVIDNGYKVKVTAYTLSEDSCGKSKLHPEYGITASGYSLKGQTLETARTIAVDPKVIPMGSKVRILFKDKEFSYLNGEYTARDTGRLIKNNKIDLYYGEENDNEARLFGVREAYIEVIN